MREPYRSGLGSVNRESPAGFYRDIGRDSIGTAGSPDFGIRHDSTLRRRQSIDLGVDLTIRAVFARYGMPPYPGSIRYSHAVTNPLPQPLAVNTSPAIRRSSSSETICPLSSRTRPKSIIRALQSLESTVLAHVRIAVQSRKSPSGTPLSFIFDFMIVRYMNPILL